MQPDEPTREPASSPCQAPPGYWDEKDGQVDEFPEPTPAPEPPRPHQRDEMPEQRKRCS
jgi:hypothetical protein